MAFWLAYFSQFFKGPTATWWKTRVNIGRAERYGKHIIKLLEDDIPEMEKLHLVTRFLRQMTSIVKQIKKAGHSTTKILFNELTMDLAEENELKDLIDKFHKYIAKLPRDAKIAVLKFLAEEDLRILKEVQSERKEYFTIEAIIVDIAKFKQDREALMTKVRSLFKRKAELGSMLERIAWRKASSNARKYFGLTKQASFAMDHTLGKIVRDKAGLTKDLEAELRMLSEDINEMFYESYLVKERAILFILKLIYVIDRIDIKLQEDVASHFLPEHQIREARENVAIILEDIGKDLHKEIEQGFRISMHRLSAEEKEIKALARA